MSSRPAPPAQVPTLTEIVQPGPAGALASAGAAEQNPAVHDLQALLVQRVMQSLTPMLEQHVQEAIRQLVLTHADALMPRLQEQARQLARSLVAQAFEQESVHFQPTPKA